MAGETDISGSYSFLDVNAAITGPNITADLSRGGYAGEGIHIRMLAEKDVMTIGAGGAGQHALVANQSARLTLTLLKISPLNALLNQAMNLDKMSSATWGQNHITLTNLVSGDSISAAACAFVKEPDIGYNEQGPVMVWEFNSVKTEQILGNGFQPVGI